MQTFINPPKENWSSITERPQINRSDLKKVVSEILEDVKQNGDEAVKRYSLRFEKVQPVDLLVSAGEISGATLSVTGPLKKAIQVARANIEKFHRSQTEAVTKIETAPGIFCWRKSVAIERVGLYIPGGTAPLFSTLLMLAIPAAIAGCNEIIICTPPGKDGKVNDVILYVAFLLGLNKVYKVGGVQAIGALAYGTQTIPKVYKIFGPGNQFVTAAKQQVSSEGTAIDMPAGPSEVAVYADKSCVHKFVAADLLSQAEHGKDSQVLLVADSQQAIETVMGEMRLQLEALPRKDIIEGALLNARSVVLENVDSAFEFLNSYAPEHLIIASDHAEELSHKVINAGSVFIGNYSPESAGDYASGTNHTLPTNGYARAYSGVSVDTFLKKITFQSISREGIKNIGKEVEIMAEAEGLDAHKNAVTVRLNHL